MLNSPFKRAIGALFSELGLPTPLFDAEDGETFRLEIENSAIDLELTPDAKAILLTLDLGLIANRGLECERAAKSLLKVSLAMCGNNRAAIRVKPDTAVDGRTFLQIFSIARVESHSSYTLSHAIEDMLQMLEVSKSHVEEAGDTSENAAKPRAAAREDDESAMLIFRP